MNSPMKSLKSNQTTDLNADTSLNLTSGSKSLEERINEARKRAENFSISLSEARKKESSSLKAIEDDRKKWSAAYTAKAVELEQVERELAHAIVSIKAQEMAEDAMNNHSSMSQHDGIRSNSRISLSKPNSHHASPIRSNVNDTSQQSLQDNHSNQALQHELVSTKSQLDVATKQLEVYQYKMENLNSSNTKLASALRDAEGKLDIRLSQVVQSSEDREYMRSREQDLQDKVSSLENQARFQHSELSVASSELRAAMSKIKILEGQLSQKDRIELVTSQDLKIKGLEEHSSKLTARIDSLERAHHEELARIDARSKDLIAQLQDERAKRQQTQHHNDNLTRANNVLSTEKQSLAHDVKSLHDRLMELQKMIPMLIADRDKLAMQSMELSHSRTTSPLRQSTSHRHHQHDAGVDLPSSAQHHSPIHVPRPSAELSSPLNISSPTQPTSSSSSSPIRSVESKFPSPTPYDDESRMYSPKIILVHDNVTKVNGSHSHNSISSTSTASSAKPYASEHLRRSIEFPNLHTIDDSDEREQKLLARIAYIHKLQEAHHEAERSLDASIFANSTTHPLLTSYDQHQPSQRKLPQPYGHDHDHRIHRNQLSQKSKTSTKPTTPVSNKCSSSTKKKKPSYTMQPSAQPHAKKSSTPTKQRHASPSNSKQVVKPPSKASSKSSPSTSTSSKIIIRGYHIDPSAVTLVPTTRSSSPSLSTPRYRHRSPTASEYSTMSSNPSTKNSHKKKINMTIPHSRSRSSSNEPSKIMHDSSMSGSMHSFDRSTLSMLKNPLLDVSSNGYRPSLSHSVDDVPSFAKYQRAASPAMRSLQMMSMNDLLTSSQHAPRRRMKRSSNVSK